MLIKKIILQIFLCMLAVFLAAFAVFNIIGTDPFPLVVAVIPVFFVLQSVLLAWFAGKYSTEPPVPSVLLAAKVSKMAACVIVFLAGLALAGSHKFFFVAVFAASYTVYLVYESITLINMNKNYK